MWSEEWDKKFREAAVQDPHPADPEKGWQQMEPLLEKHLPQDRRKRRFFFLIFLLGGISAAVYFNLRSVQLPVSPSPVQSHITPNDAHRADSAQKPPALSPQKISGKEEVVANNNTAVPFIINSPSSQPLKSQNPQPGPDIEKNYSPGKKSTPIAGAREKSSEPRSAPSVVATPRTAPQKEETAYVHPADNSNPVQAVTERESISKDHDSTGATDPEPHETGLSLSDSTTRPPLKESVVKRPGSRWGISLLGSADISGVRPSEPGSWRTAYGVGISYAINNRITVRTGFMRSRKVYSAGGGDYNPPKRFWDYVSELDHVDANCLVYEIPLNVQYFFGRNANWFASAGMHSMLMKNETYHYDYKDMSGQERYMSRTFKNYSNHFFGLLNLSGGYRFPLTKKIRISAEPYMQIPLGGVGYGKVKLYSGGMLFSATFNR